MLKIAIILGSTRPGRIGEGVARWVHETARQLPLAGCEFELVDIAAQNLPLLDEPVPPLMGKYSKQHTKEWARKIASYDAFVFVTAEYNHGIPGALKNAIDFLYKEWNDKAAGFVSYGSAGGVRAVEALRLSLAELQVATVRNQLFLSLARDFESMRSEREAKESYQTFKPKQEHADALKDMLEQLVRWAGALQQLRAPAQQQQQQQQDLEEDAAAAVTAS